MLRSLRTLSVVLLACAFSAALAAQTSVERVEPPNWWIGLEPAPMLLIYGKGFQGAKVTTNYPGIAVSRTQSSQNGDYLFCWLRIASSAQPGTARLSITSPSGTATAALPLARRDNRGGHAGLSTDDVIYLLMPDRFADGDAKNNTVAGREGDYDRSTPKAYHGGDLRGITDHLAYIKDLGATAIWMTPVWQNSDKVDYHGYHVANMYAVEPHFGNLADLQQLVSSAHRLGLKIVYDYVANHTGPEHPWINDPPTPTWFHGTTAKHMQPVYKFDGIVDPHAPASESRATLEGWFVDRLPDLNPDDPLLAQYLLQNAEWWMESTGADAYRIDTLPYSSRKFWSGWIAWLDKSYPRMFTVGEVADGDPTITSFFMGGRKQFDGVDTHLSSVFDFPMEYTLRDVIFSNAPAKNIPQVLQRDWLYPNPQSIVTMIGNHDHKRVMGLDGATPAKLKAAFAMLALMRGIPQIYSGDEIAMDGGDDPENRHDFPGGFPGDAHNAFTAAGRTPLEQDVYAYVQSLMQLRAQHAALRSGRHWHLAWDDSFYSFMREDGKERFVVVLNSSAQARQLSIALADTPAAGFATLTPLLGAPPAQIVDNAIHVSVPASSVAVYSLR